MPSVSESPLVLVIDDSATIRKMVECHLSQAGYRVSAAADAEHGLKLAESIRPHLILLDHQLPGSTGEDVCRRLLQIEATAKVPVLISSAMRNRAFARYTEFPNVIDQIPKPFTPELLKSGVANALQTGAAVVQAQRTGCAMPEWVSELEKPTLEGETSAFSLHAVIDFLTNTRQTGRLTLEMEHERISIGVAAGRIQSVSSPTWAPERMEVWIPPELGELATLLSITLGDRQDAPTSGLVRVLERSLSDPRRLRLLLRIQAGVLIYHAITGQTGHFTFEPGPWLPPMFQAFPLQVSLPALLVEGARRCAAPLNLAEWSGLVFARHTVPGGSLDRAGLSPVEMRIHVLLDGTNDLSAVAQSSGVDVAEAAVVAHGLELAGLVERRLAPAQGSILVLENDAESARLIQRVLGAPATGYQVKVVRDRVGAQLLLRHGKFDLIMLALDNPEQEPFYRSCRAKVSATTWFVGILRLDAGCPLARIDALGLDGVLHRPVAEVDLLATVNHLLGGESRGVSRRHAGSSGPNGHTEG
jgi:DNA-binding response OmpR family regulator